MSITVVEMPARRSRPGARSGLRESGCGWCGALVRCDGAARLTSTRPLSTFTGNAGTRSSSNPGSPTPVPRWNFPTVPGTSDVIAVETAVAERPADVVADVRHYAELSILERDRDGDGLRLATLERSPREFLDAADVDPVFLTSHGVPPMLVLGVQPLTPGFHVNLSIEEIGASLSIGPKRLVRAFVDTTAHRCWNFNSSR